MLYRLLDLHLIEALHGISLLIHCQADLCSIIDRVLALLAQKTEDQKILLKIMKDLARVNCDYIIQHSEHYKFLCPLM